VVQASHHASLDEPSLVHKYFALSVLHFPEHFSATHVLASEDIAQVHGQAALMESIADDAAQDTLEALVGEYARFVYAVASSVLRNPHDAEDATQETFLRVMRHQHEIKGVKDVRAWLARICWRIAVDRRRGAHVSEAVADDSELLEQLRAPGAGIEQTVVTGQMLEIAERLIARLPSELRDVLTLSTVEEMNSREIAEVLGIHEGTVRTRLLRARQLLKEKFASLLEGKIV
jgi:RNA polymerase sigma-70 factor (ECF subfamily)